MNSQPHHVHVISPRPLRGAEPICPPVRAGTEQERRPDGLTRRGMQRACRSAMITRQPLGVQQYFLVLRISPLQRGHATCRGFFVDRAIVPCRDMRSDVRELRFPDLRPGACTGGFVILKSLLGRF